MMRTLSRRLARLEGGSGEQVPNVILVGTYDTPAGALAAFAAAYPDRSRRHAPLVVPAKVATADDHARFAERFAASQWKLVAEARSERLAIVPEQPAEPLIVAAPRSCSETAEPPTRFRRGTTFAASHRLTPSMFARMAGISFNDR